MKPKQIQNNPQFNTLAMLSGYHFEHKNRLHLDAENRIVYKKNLDKVAVISGGGSGHEPAHFGYVGEGLLTASINGDFFIPPKPEQIVEAIEKADSGKGVLLVVKNFTADVTSFTEAKSLAESYGHQVELVCVSDDHSIEGKTSFKKRHRGVAGTVLVHKILGFYAQEGASLTELKQVGDELTANLFTLGVALKSAVLPDSSKPVFELGDHEVSYGVGIHGEEGYRKVPYHSSEQLAIELVNKMRRIIDWNNNDKFAILVNGLGSTTLMEQYIFTNDLRRLLQIENIEVDYIKVGSHLTSYNMHGVSLTFLKIKNSDWTTALNQPTDASNW
ncbi:DhaKLM operon coactivator DhaQ [Alkalibacterium sp. s-m-22]